MKKASRVLAFALVAIMLFTMLPLSSLAVSTALQDYTIVAFGDSLTRFGSVSDGGATTSTGSFTYPYYLGTNAYLGVPIINAGVGGDTTGMARARFEEDVLAHNPDLVIICLGMNDQAMSTLTGDPLTDIDTYRANLSYFAETLIAMGSDVVFVTPNSVNTNPGYYTTISYNLNYAGGYLDDFCNVMREVAIEYDCTLVDINYECDFEDLDKFCAGYGDGIHHSDYGRKQYAEYISTHLEAVYDGANKATMTVTCVDENGKTLKTYNMVGAAGAHVTLASPAIRGYSAITADVETTFIDGATFTFEYSFDLNDYIDEAMKISAKDYDDIIISELRDAVATAKALMADANTTSEDLLACSDKLAGLLNAKNGGEYIASVGKSYTVSGTAHSNYSDSGVCLTDSVILKEGGSGYAGWTSDAEIVVDLGTATNLNTFRIHTAGGQWGIIAPASLTVSYSLDGESYTDIGKDSSAELMINSITWDTHTLTVTSEIPVSARYVKYSVAKSGNFVWIGEVQASLDSDKPDGQVYITGVNSKVSAGDCIVYTPDFGIIDFDKANHVWTDNVIAEYDADNGVYVVTDVLKGTGADTTPNVSLNEGQIMIAAHDWESGITDGSEVIGSAANVAMVKKLAVGDTFVLSGIDAEGNVEVAPYVYNEKFASEPLKSGVVSDDATSFFVSHYNDNAREGAGVIFTDGSFGAAWWLAVSFKPVEGYDNVYEVVKVSNKLSSATGVALEVPEGGFVWGGNVGNNYPDLYAKNPTAYAAYADPDKYPDYTNPGANNACNFMKKLKAGEQYVIEGLDFDRFVVPTSTVDLNWYDDNYVCTATINKFEAPHVHDDGEWTTLEDGSKELRCTECGELLDTEPAPEQPPVDPDILLGDVNDDGVIDMFDYLLVKSFYFEVAIPTEDEALRADMNEDGVIDMFDYLMVKTAYFNS